MSECTDELWICNVFKMRDSATAENKSPWIDWAEGEMEPTVEKHAYFEQLTEVQSVKSILSLYLQDHVVSWEL